MTYAYQDLSRSITGRRAIITGAASGMGRATAHLFAREGAIVAVTDVDKDRCQVVVDELAAAGINTASAFALDVGDPVQIKSVVAQIATSFEGIDILVNNAGIAHFVELEDSEAYEASWHKSISILLTAHQRMVRACLPHLKESDAARIVNIASTEGLGATPGNSPYVAAKHGVTGLTKGLAVDLGKYGITVNCICPGPIRTGMTDAIPDDQKAVFAKRRTALRRYGLPEEVAHMTLSCVLPSASFMTGAIIPIDGGLIARNA